MNPAKKWILPVLMLGTLALAGCGNNITSGDEQVREGQEEVPSDALEKGREIQAKGWVVPSYSATEQKAILAGYANLDPNKLVPRNLLNKALLYFHRNESLIDNKKYITVVDFSKHSRYERFFSINMQTGAVIDLHTAHGSGSDPTNSGYATKFSNTPSSEMSSLGFYQVSELYEGVHGTSIRLDGLSTTNSHVRERAIVIHGANYVYDSDTKAGRSSGCPALSWTGRAFAVSHLNGGSLMYVGRSRFE